MTLFVPSFLLTAAFEFHGSVIFFQMDRVQKLLLIYKGYLQYFS
jgi:hypothetical protein